MTQKALTENLSRLSGAAFEKSMPRRRYRITKVAVKLFSTESKSGKDADLKAWAWTTLPTLKTHLQAAQALQTEMK